VVEVALDLGARHATRRDVVESPPGGVEATGMLKDLVT
jgi:hypothetical protein